MNDEKTLKMPEDGIISSIEIRQQKLSDKYKPGKKLDSTKGIHSDYDDKTKHKINFTKEKEKRKYIIVSFYPHLEKKYYDDNFNLIFNEKINGYYELNGGSYKDNVKQFCSSTIVPIKGDKIQTPVFNQMFGVIFDTSELDYIAYDWHDAFMNNGKKMYSPKKIEEINKDDMVKKIKLKYTNNDYDKIEDKNLIINEKIITSYLPIDQTPKNKLNLIQFALEQNERHFLNQSKICSNGLGPTGFIKQTINNLFTKKISVYNELTLQAPSDIKWVKAKGIVINKDCNPWLGNQNIENQDLEDVKNVFNFLKLKNIPFVYITECKRNSVIKNNVVIDDGYRTFEVKKISEFIASYIESKKKNMNEEQINILNKIQKEAEQFEESQINFIYYNKAKDLKIKKDDLIKHLSEKYKNESEVQFIDHLLNDFDDIKKYIDEVKSKNNVVQQKNNKKKHIIRNIRKKIKPMKFVKGNLYDKYSKAMDNNGRINYKQYVNNKQVNNK